MMTTWFSTLFLFGFITIWGAVGLVFLVRGLWLLFGAPDPRHLSEYSLAVAFQTREQLGELLAPPRLYGYCHFVSNWCYRLLS